MRFKQQMKVDNFFDISLLGRGSDDLKEAGELTRTAANNVSSRLEKAERKNRIFENIFDGMSDSVVINSFDGEILFVNEAFEELTGWSFEDVVGQNVSMLRPENYDNDKIEEIRRCLANGRTWEGKNRNVNKDGSIIVNQLHITPISNGVKDKPYFFSVRKPLEKWDGNERRNITRKRPDRRKNPCGPMKQK